MTLNLNLRKKLVAAGVAATVVVGTGGAVAWAQTSGPSTTTAPPATAAANANPNASAATGLPFLRTVARRVIHADLIVKDKDGQFVTVTVDRGTVAAVNAGSITLDRPDGKQVTLTINGDTAVHGVASVTAVQTGKAAIVASRNGAATQILQAKS
jgi:hypothetical protein